jgi:hypothetical protein
MVCAAAIRLGEALWGGNSIVPLSGWWGDMRVADQPASTLFRDAPIHCAFI